MALTLYNTLTRSADEFQPVKPGEVRIYGCGPTVYQIPHIGNYRSFIFYDLLHRYLEWKGYRVKFVMNLTDVDDRTINGAAAAGVSLAEVTEPLAAGFFEELHTLGVRDADVFPRATRHIPQMIELIQELVERKHAYIAESGDVYFDIPSWPEYGKLSRVDFAASREGAGQTAPTWRSTGLAAFQRAKSRGSRLPGSSVARSRSSRPAPSREAAKSTRESLPYSGQEGMSK